MLKLQCLLNGEDAPFSVEVANLDAVTVADLKEMITVKRQDGIFCDSNHLKLYLALKDEQWLSDELTEKTDVQVRINPSNFMRATKNLSLYLNEKDLTLIDGLIHVLVVLPTKMTMQPFIYLDGINVQAPHLERVELVSRVHDNLQNLFTFFLSPAASGKTSLLLLFANRYRSLHCIPITFVAKDSAADALRRCGIDIDMKTTTLNRHEEHVVMIDDAQAKYEEKGFWSYFIKHTSSWLPRNIRFIICATHALNGGVESPVEFQSFIPFSRKDFLLNDEEAAKFLALPLIGLPDNMRQPNLVQLVIRECNGLVGALRITVDSLKSYFQKVPIPSEAELMDYFLSQDCVRFVARCFGSQHTTPPSLKLQRFLSRCLIAPSFQVLSEKESEYLVTLRKAGILVGDVRQPVQFSSPLAEKYYSRWLFPRRAMQNPSSLHDLIAKVIRSMSASVLRQSVVDETSFPIEAAFQHEFMQALALITDPSCSICPELSRVFPSPSESSAEPSMINGEIDFYLNGTLRWGLELLVNGNNISERMARFGPNGKYAALRVSDYAIIDLRTGEFTSVIPMEKRVTMFFCMNDISKCSCIFGLDETVHEFLLAL